MLVWSVGYSDIHQAISITILMLQVLNLELAHAFHLFDDAGLYHTMLAIIRQLIARVASKKNFACGILRALSLVSADSTNDHVRYGQNEPNGREYFDLYLGFLELF